MTADRKYLQSLKFALSRKKRTKVEKNMLEQKKKETRKIQQ